MFLQKSYVLKASDAERKWYRIDAEGQIVGRLATEVANILRGKNNPKYTPNTDSGDFVVIVNADKVQFTGDKWNKKKYYSHSRYIGSLKEKTAAEQLEKHPERIIMSAVKGMLPKTSLGRNQLKKLKVFTGPEHTHEAQKPVEYKIK